MGYQTERRRRQIRRKGRMMALSRANNGSLPAPVAVNLIAYSAPPATAALEAGVSVMPFVAEILNDELQAAGYGRPHNMDQLKDGDRIYTLTDATAVYDGDQICGWKLFAAGGT
ncbi:hypothetical protein [Gluconobacter frateurii]|uniref:Uncharacterized protein n=1 Tax=Gluconobacter frateurii NRIC 0228 TaxID=1307946 RepID=A0ABQ0Q722_9PROT|nr:hypothetical protein [Gluconobacter frateurii]GBR07463.1 hypothetical protein AA0228_0011 [Gluconobacter frateurii NRIC 0228]GLP91424.1 hypothetical protein GCM10007868_24990 [Gluconobacter frateurii]